MQTPSPAQAPASPAIPKVVVGPGSPAPTAVWRAFNAQRKELANQLEQLEDKRGSLQRQIQENEVPPGPARQGVEQRIVDLDKRIADVDKQLAVADKNVAEAAAVPNAVQQERPQNVRTGPPEEVYFLTGMFIVVVLLPLSIAMARRIWRKGTAAVMAFPQELTDRLNRLDHAVDSVAVEVERIGEGQRFVTRVMSENGRALGVGAAVPVESAARDKVRERGSM